MIRQAISFLILAGIITLGLLIAAPALGSNGIESARQTWPSRTPTPSGPPQQPNPPGTTPPEPTSTEVVEPGSTPIPTGQATAPTAGQATLSPGSPSLGSSEGVTEENIPTESESIQFPSAADVGDCGLPPLVVALGPVNVRSGPGIEFETIAELDFQAERPIIGRSAVAAWWQILLASGWQGWVSDQAVTVVGYIGAVPITAETPDEANQPPWNPTPNPVCTPPSQEEISIVDGQLDTVLSAESSPVPTDAGSSPEIDESLDGASSQGPEFSPLGGDEQGSGFTMIWLPILGGLLILAGLAGVIIQRRQQ